MVIQYYSDATNEALTRPTCPLGSLLPTLRKKVYVMIVPKKKKPTKILLHTETLCTWLGRVVRVSPGEFWPWPFTKLGALTKPSRIDMGSEPYRPEKDLSRVSSSAPFSRNSLITSTSRYLRPSSMASFRYYLQLLRRPPSRGAAICMYV
jgi:hypothetical protein